MPETNEPQQTYDRMFNDRRSDNPATGKQMINCRRGSDFGEVETMPWWLKVNYVSQHLNAVHTTTKDNNC